MEFCGKLPLYSNFLGRRADIFDCSYMELQDIATAFGLHEIRVDDTVEDLQKNTVIAYLKRIKGLTDKQLKEMSFYRYDKLRMKYYIEFDKFDKKQAILNNYYCADLEEFEEEEEALNGFRSISELFDDSNSKRPIVDNDNNTKEEDINNLIADKIKTI